MNSFFYQLFRTIFFIFLKVFNRLEVIGDENIPEKGGVIVAANHVSYLDPPVIGVALKRQAAFIAKEGLFRIPLLGMGIKAFSVPVKRDRPQPSTIKEAVSRLKKGGILVLFPEGGRSANGSFLDAKRGVGMIAATSSAPVVPALIEGTDRAFPVGAKFFRPAKIRVIFGTPLKIEKKETDKHFQERISREIMERIKNLKLEKTKLI
ncbi:MAG TPA: lysophospholipid acyltransferase family protein [Thermodesulfovibrionales bacterium]|nr:lysophospholipid acyltransferase family protein [Thermodesulfovibrionales bacterium]